MCGPTSAIGLVDYERVIWLDVKDQLRQPGRLAGLMRCFLGNEEVAVVVATTPGGVVHALALLVTDAIAAEIELPGAAASGWVTGHIADNPVEIWLGRAVQAEPRPVALKLTHWIEEHLLLYARRLWWPRYQAPVGRPVW